MKKKILLVFIALFLLLIKIDVSAECTSDELQALKTEALNISTSLKLSVVFGEEDEFLGEDEIPPYYYDLTINNMNENFYSDVGKGNNSGEVNLEKAYLNGGYSENINVYASDSTKCPNTLVRTIYITVPFYNRFSKYDECKNYSNYDVCKENFNASKMTDSDFKEEIEKIKANEEKIRQEKENQKNNDKTFLNIVKNFINDNMLLVVSIIVIITLVVIIVIIIIIKNKNKIKINLDGE